jgi:rubrerythrin
MLLKKVRKSPPSVDEALKTAVELEDRLSACHMNTLMVFNDTALGKLFEAMGNNDCDHVGMLQGVLNNISANKSVPAVPS